MSFNHKVSKQKILRQEIEEEIRRRGPMPFSRYMELCLYHPELGYYSRHAEQFGKAGDFYTSSDIHAVFGRLLARQFEEMWRALGSPPQIEILELGPGRGLFARDVLDWSQKKFPPFFAAVHYSLLERSPALQAHVRETLAGYFGGGKSRLLTDEVESQGLKPESEVALHGTAEAVPFPRPSGQSLQDLPRATTGKGRTSVVPEKAATPRALAPEVPLVLFANEFFDALPVEVLSPQGQLHIALENGRLAETWLPSSPSALEFLDRYSVHPEPGERLEAPLAAQRYMEQIAQTMPHGFVIAIDYGYTRDEQLAGRHRGTLTAYRRHSVSANPYQAPGEQDITAHANFTALASAAERHGMGVQPLLTQSQFLLGIGEQNEFADAFEECRLPQERAKVALQLKHLVTPAGVGETFHVLVASKGLEAGKVERLSGLSFGRPERS